MHIVVIAFLVYGNLKCSSGYTIINSPLIVDCQYLSSGIYEYTQECSAYLSCRNAESELKYCSADKLFNKILQICDTPESVDCNATDYSMTSRTYREENQCVGQTAGNSFPLMTDCQQYMLCLGNDQSVIAKCPVNAWYEPKTGNCGPDVSPTACRESQLTSTTPTSSRNPDELCSDEELGVSFPFVADCKKYIVCLGNGKSAIVNCIFNAWFDPLTGNCGPEVSPTACMETFTTVAPTTKMSTLSTSTVVSTTLQTTTEPPIGPDVCAGLINKKYVAYPDNCSKYIVCVEPIPIAFYCTPGYYFSENLQECVDWAQSDCPAVETTVQPPECTTPAPSICENNSGGTLPFPENCRWFIKCINDNVYMMGVCNNEEYYDPFFGICSASTSPDACLEDYVTTTTDGVMYTTKTTNRPAIPSTTTTTSKPTTTPTPHPCDGVADGKLVPYPNDCTKFIRCERPTPVVYDCVEGQEFSASLERCMAPWIANCTVVRLNMKNWIVKM